MITPEACIHASTSPRPTRCEPMDGIMHRLRNGNQLRLLLLHQHVTSPGPPSLPTFDNEKLVCFVDAAWDASTRNCGMAGVFKGREQGKFQSFKDSRRYVDSALIVWRSERRFWKRLYLMRIPCWWYRFTSVSEATQD
ncbi:hypothetical protein Bca52824_086381 [Brassica carinata]|uniref:Uncharacterized protein n=1 Tax=Brassica carinata TaxID=52824 RepID=A0A8X7P9I4_BRACI|nr:hypothetical protein Bca52824_086381 [Brassica carinata]